MKFVKLRYFIHQRYRAPKRVHGYAFETPGWPDFHACVRFDCRESWSSKRWIMDHFESGLAISFYEDFDIKSKATAPSVLATFLDKKGREKVNAVIAPYITKRKQEEPA